MPSRQRAAILVVLAALYLSAMFVLTHRPMEGHGAGSGLDKLVHAAMYAGLAMLLLAALSVLRPVSLRTALGVVLIAAAYGAVDEWTQRLVPSRTSDPWDWVADVIGAAVGATLFLAGKKILSRRSDTNPTR